MNCELCGFSDERFYKVEIEGAILVVCSKCANSGKILDEVLTQGKDQTKSLRSKTADFGYDIDPNYSSIIKSALDKEGIDPAGLASRMKESPSEVEKVVSGRIFPTEALARKIEKSLGIKLLIEDSAEFTSVESGEGLKFEDVVNIKKKES